MAQSDEEYLAELMGSVSTGLPDNFTGTLKNVIFTSAPDYREGALFLSADIVDIDDPDIGDDGTIEDQRFGIGGTGENAKYRWKTEDKGASVVRDDGKRASFNNGTAVGRLLAALLAQDSFKSAVTKRAQAGARLTPMQAAFYEGIRGHWTRVEDTFRDREGNMRTMNYLVIDEFEDIVGKKATPAKKAAAKKAAPKPAAAKPAAKADAEDADGDAGTPASNGNEAAIAAIEAIAREVCNPEITDGDLYGDYEHYQTRCYAEIDGLDESPELMAIVDSYEEGSVWDRVVAEAG